MLPCGAAAGESRLDPGCGRQGLREVALRFTTRFENAHRTVRRELLYRLHPWFGRDVFVHGAVERANGVFRCTLDGSDIARSLEIPSWMFDCAACVSHVCIVAKPFVDLQALRALSVLLDRVLKTDTPSSNARLRDAYGVSRDQNRPRPNSRVTRGHLEARRGFGGVFMSPKLCRAWSCGPCESSRLRARRSPHRQADAPMRSDRSSASAVVRIELPAPLRRRVLSWFAHE